MRGRLGHVSIQVIERRTVRIATLRYTGAFGEPLAGFWRKRVRPWLADHGLVDCPRYGIALDNPRTTPEDQCRYDAGVELPPGLSIPDAAQADLPGGRYAVTRFRGTAAQIGAAWDDFIGVCIAAELRFDHTRTAFEHYPRGARFDEKSGVFECELCFPVGS